MRKEIRPLLKSFLLLSLPTVAEQILSTLFQYVDTAMVGRLGEEATASVSVTSTIGWLVGSVIYGGGAAILTLTARAYGAKDKEKGEMLSSLSLILALVFGILIGGISVLLSPRIPVWMGADVKIRDQASRYFTIISLPMFFRALTALCGSAVRGAQDTRRPMVISLTVSLLNVVLDYILIYPCGYGVTGAAAATAVCFTVSGILNLILMRRTPFLRQKGWRMPGRRLVRESLEIAFPVMGISCVTCMGYVVDLHGLCSVCRHGLRYGNDDLCGSFHRGYRGDDFLYTRLRTEDGRHGADRSGDRGAERG